MLLAGTHRTHWQITCGHLTGALRGDRFYLSFLRVFGRNPQNSLANHLWAPDRSTQGRQVLFVVPACFWQEPTELNRQITCGPLTEALRGDRFYLSFLRVFGRNPQNSLANHLWAPDRSTQGRQVLKKTVPEQAPKKIKGLPLFKLLNQSYNLTTTIILFYGIVNNGK